MSCKIARLNRSRYSVDAESSGPKEHVLHWDVDASTGRGTFGMSGRLQSTAKHRIGGLDKTKAVQTRAQQLLGWTTVPEQSGPKSELLLCPFPWGELGPHLTHCLLDRGISIPSGILIHPAVSPQYTNVTDRTDRQDRQAGWFLRPDCAPSSECPQFGTAE